ncbi:MAG: hypothetical protein P8047_02065 [Gammaproteobacteria bacterium]
MREMTPGRRLAYAILKPVMKLLFGLIWSTCRVVRIEGEEHVNQVSADGKPFIPCYWHQHHFFTGAQALRDMYNIVVKQRISPVSTSDGPTGPLHVFKIGDILLSQFTQAPLLPLSYAASRAWYLKSWDRFIIPKPFARIVITIGTPLTVPKGLLAEDLEPYRLQMQNSLRALTDSATKMLQSDAKHV